MAKKAGHIVGGFAALPNAYFKTPEFAALSGRAVKLLIELILQYRRPTEDRPGNNGDLSITRSTMLTRGFTSNDQLFKARDELINAGWIVQTRQGGLKIPSLYALTFVGIDPCNGKLEVEANPMPIHLWKSEKAALRETRSPVRTAVQAVPPHGTTKYRHAVQREPHRTATRYVKGLFRAPPRTALRTPS